MAFLLEYVYKMSLNRNYFQNKVRFDKKAVYILCSVKSKCNQNVIIGKYLKTRVHSQWNTENLV